MQRLYRLHQYGLPVTSALSISQVQFAFSAIHQLDKARTILTNAMGKESADDIERSIGYALEEIDSVFRSAKERAAELQGMDDADVE